MQKTNLQVTVNQILSEGKSLESKINSFLILTKRFEAISGRSLNEKKKEN